MVTTDTNRKNELNQSINSKRDALNKYMEKYANTKLDSFEVDVLKKYKVNSTLAQKEKGDVLNLALANKDAESYAEYNKSVSSLNEKISKNLSDLASYNIKSADQLNQKNKANYNEAVVIIIGVLLLALIVVFSVSIFVTNLIAKPIKNMESYIKEIAEGDLSEETLVKARKSKMYSDEIGKLGNSIIDMRHKLYNLLSKVSEASEQIAASSQELNANTEESSRGIEETAKAVNTIASEIETQLNTIVYTSSVIQQMSENTHQVAINTTDTAKVANKALAATDEGGKAISITKEQMNNIESIVNKLDDVIKILGDRSSEIGQIVEVISGIAEETNLLALNAAIEAARAGEQGKGFAVVAEEVRKLAESSKESTGKISMLIGHIQQNTDNAVSAMKEGTNQVRIGKEVVEKAGQSFEDISKLVHEIASKIQEVATASESIVEGSHQIVSSMNKVNEISKEVCSHSQTIDVSVQEETASMYEIASSSEGLAKIGEELMEELNKFKL
jgi:methyl-accepting chemotaxis protein